MKPQKIDRLLAGVILAIIAGCTILRPSSPTPSDSVATPMPSTPPPVADGSPPPSNYQPDSRMVLMSVEGQSTEVELKLLDNPSLPFTTYFPAKDFVVDQGAAGANNLHFYFSPTGVKNEKAYINIVFPSPPMDSQDIRNLILGEQGLLAQNGWELVDRTDIVSYPWAKEKLMFRHGTAQDTAVGAIYIGEDRDRAFYALTYYPAEFGDGFEPRSNVVLENLELRK